MRKLLMTLPFIWLAGLVAAAVGYVMNIISIVHSINDPYTPMFVVRCVGIFFAPLGAVLGYF